MSHSPQPATMLADPGATTLRVSFLDACVSSLTTPNTLTGLAAPGSSAVSTPMPLPAHL